jgi:NADPH:quinone reductase-like Zn-dependent oxidoreductase
LWHAGASSVSIAGIQLSKGNGASKIFITAGSDEKVDFCVNQMGATKGFNYRTENWSQGVLDATDGHGADVTVDFVGRDFLQGNFECAAVDGRIVQLASLSGYKIKEGTDITHLEQKRLRWEGSRLRSRSIEYQRNLRNLLVEHALPKFANGEFKMSIEKVFPWERVQDAHRLMESNQTKGKLICTIDARCGTTACGTST